MSAEHEVMIEMSEIMAYWVTTETRLSPTRSIYILSPAGKLCNIKKAPSPDLFDAYYGIFVSALPSCRKTGPAPRPPADPGAPIGTAPVPIAFLNQPCPFFRRAVTADSIARRPRTAATPTVEASHALPATAPLFARPKSRAAAGVSNPRLGASPKHPDRRLPLARWRAGPAEWSGDGTAPAPGESWKAAYPPAAGRRMCCGCG